MYGSTSISINTILWNFIKFNSKHALELLQCAFYDDMCYYGRQY